MFYVSVYKNEDLLIKAPFKEKDKAIKYFNFIADRKNPYLIDYDHIEIFDNNVCIFDSEV